MTETGTRLRPQIDHPADLDRLVEQIVAKMDPVAIYLFGSRARGDADDDSDYDLLVVVRDDIPDDLLKTRWLSPSGASTVDVKTRPKARFESRLGQVGTLEHEVACEGLQLYPLGPNPFDSEGPINQMPDPSANLEIVREWLARARWHLPGAKMLFGNFPETAAFHLQQAAENLTRAALIAHQIRPPACHSIGKAAAKLPLTFEDRDRFLAQDHLSDFFWAYRYPSPPGAELPPMPSSDDVRRWLAEIDQLVADFERWLETRGPAA